MSALDEAIELERQVMLAEERARAEWMVAFARSRQMAPDDPRVTMWQKETRQRYDEMSRKRKMATIAVEELYRQTSEAARAKTQTIEQVMSLASKLSVAKAALQTIASSAWGQDQTEVSVAKAALYEIEWE